MGDRKFHKGSDDDQISIKIISQKNICGAHFSVEPSKEKDYDIFLMTGNNSGKDSENK